MHATDIPTPIDTAGQTPEGLPAKDGSPRLWSVSGICMVPTRCTRIVEAATEADAIALAIASDWQKHIDPMSSDEGAAFDWQPFAEEITKSPLPAWQQPVRANDQTHTHAES